MASAALSFIIEKCNNYYLLYHLTLFRKHFPLRVRINSRHPLLEQHSLFINTLLQVHFIKTTEAAILTSQGKQYLLPLSSSVKFSPLYDPENDFKKSLVGYRFESIKQLLQTHPQPIAVYVVEGFLHDDDHSTSESNDIYVIDCSKNINCQETLICKDVRDSTTKMFPSYCDCNLTTAPSKVCLFPSDFIANLKLPAKIVFLGPFRSVHQLESEQIFTVTEITTVDSLVASLEDDLSSYDKDKDLIEIYLDLPVEVEILSSTLTESEFHGLNDEVPPYMPKVTIYDENKYSNDDFQQLLLTSTAVSPDKKDHDEYAGSLGLTYREFKSSFSGTMDEPFKRRETRKGSGMSGSINVESCLEGNRRIVGEYSLTEVTDLLEKLGIGQYKEMFVSERVCGGLLMDLDDNILLNELGMKKKLDRLRLLQIIQGRRSITDYAKH